MNCKIFLVFLVLVLSFCEAAASELTTVLEVELSAKKAEPIEVNITRISAKPGYVTEPNPKLEEIQDRAEFPYLLNVKLLSQDRKEIDALKVYPIFIFSVRPLLETNETLIFVNFRYTEDAKIIEVENYDRKILSYNFAEMICNHDKSCNNWETALSCQDCTTNAADGICINMRSDGCDPDCAEDVDPDCRKIPGFFPFVLIFLIVLLVIVVLLLVLKKKRKIESKLSAVSGEFKKGLSSDKQS